MVHAVAKDKSVSMDQRSKKRLFQAVTKTLANLITNPFSYLIALV